ncbi:hypothetical protein PAHAL_8G064800 [Panicum hallii]|uniref:Uncharacterized protein n=1 Tax=Panicum hallii TaxID=206008 RepID=A0A2S3ID50_9POAL|nr:hypothetical protein PAHAL_8G064800 [Panicum hallii]
MGTPHRVVAAMVVVIVSSTLLSTTNAEDVHCIVLRLKCNKRNCNKLELHCKNWYGEHHFESVHCKKTPPFIDQCCCEFKEHSPPPPTRHHPSPPSRHHPSRFISSYWPTLFLHCMHVMQLICVKQMQ